MPDKAEPSSSCVNLTVPLPHSEPTTPSLDFTPNKQMFGLYRPFLRSIAEGKVPANLRSRFDESDLVQATLVLGVTKLHTFRGTSENEFKAWLQQIFHNQILDWIRFNRAAKRDSRQESNRLELDSILIRSQQDDELVRQEDDALVAAALNKLPQVQQQIILWRCEGATFVDIGERLGITSETARMKWGRAISRLMELVAFNESA